MNCASDPIMADIESDAYDGGLSNQKAKANVDEMRCRPDDLEGK